MLTRQILYWLSPPLQPANPPFRALNYGHAKTYNIRLSMFHEFPAEGSLFCSTRCPVPFTCTLSTGEWLRTKQCVDLRCSGKRENINPGDRSRKLQVHAWHFAGDTLPLLLIPLHWAQRNPEFPGLESLCCVSFQKITANQMNSLRGFGISHGPANLWDS